MIKSVAQCNGASIINIVMARPRGDWILVAPGCLKYHTILRPIKWYIFRRQSHGHTWAFELHCDTVDINWVGDINILTIIVFAPEVDNGTPGAIDRHYKCGHIIATLHANVIVDDLRDIYVVVGYNCGRKPRKTYILAQNNIHICWWNQARMDCCLLW